MSAHLQCSVLFYDCYGMFCFLIAMVCYGMFCFLIACFARCSELILLLNPMAPENCLALNLLHVYTNWDCSWLRLWWAGEFQLQYITFFSFLGLSRSLTFAFSELILE